jgi:NAD(P)H-dependent flavin oxidoreductase YrpB (nitropropane dioxygenase family)
METAFTELVGCRHPLQQAAMAGVAVPDLAAAVAAAGPSECSASSTSRRQLTG